MNYPNNTFYLPNSPEYSGHFWNYMKGDPCTNLLEAGMSIGGYQLPNYSYGKFCEALKAQSLFRRIGSTFFTHGATEHILGKESKDLAAWVKENEQIPIFDGMEDFSKYSIDAYKLAVFFKLDTAFLHDNDFRFEKYFIDRLARNFGSAEDDAFVNGDDVDKPIGILAENGGAEIGAETAEVTYDDVIRLFFSVKPEYRKNGIWLLNDDTALMLRTLKDKNGNYLWNQTNDTILGKPVMICNSMPNTASGKKPIAFGDFSYYWVVDRREMSIQALLEAFVDTEQIGYLGYEYLDGKLIRKDAVKVLKVAAE